MSPYRFVVLSLVIVHGTTAFADPSTSTAPAHEQDGPARFLELAPQAKPSPISLRFAMLRLRDDGGYEMVVPTVGVSHALTKSVAATASLGTASFQAHYDRDKTSDTRLFPMRVGLVGQSGPLALELGVTVTPYRETTSCGKGRASTWDLSEGLHAAVRLHVPVGDKSRSLFVEGGAQMLLDNRGLSDCRTRLMAQDYAGWVGVGLAL